MNEREVHMICGGSSYHARMPEFIPPPQRAKQGRPGDDKADDIPAPDADGRRGIRRQQQSAVAVRAGGTANSIRGVTMNPKVRPALQFIMSKSASRSSGG